ncbi:MAG: hypothetical protein H6668_19445 [Ardenticatenaceae bacterium]|nr:hypothetical protein [Ardenticatenaceae bacterium]
MSEYANKEQTRHRQSRSLFGPLLLIAIGVYFLLRNLGWVSPDLHWGAVLPLWPLLLVLLGINIIVQQAPRPLGSFLSGVVGLVAVAVFGYVLFFGVTHPLLQRLGVREETAVWQQDTVAFSREGVKTAVIRLNFDNPSARLSALSDSPNLIQGEISYLGDLQFETDVSGGEASVSLDVRSNPSQWLNPANWSGEGAKPWQIGLNPSVPLDLTLDVGNGSGNFDLSKLSLETLAVEGGNGSMDVMLPGGVYAVDVNGSNGNIEMSIPENGGQTIQVDGDNGMITVYLPRNVEARLEFNKGNGGLNVTDRFELVQGDRQDGVWETAVYGNAPHQVELIINGGNGSVRIVDR